MEVVLHRRHARQGHASLGADPLTDTAVIQAEDVSGLTPATIGPSGSLAGRAGRRRDRLAVRPRRRPSPAASSARSERPVGRGLGRRRATAPSTRPSRPTRRSTPATAAVRWSTWPATSSASTPRSGPRAQLPGGRPVRLDRPRLRDPDRRGAAGGRPDAEGRDADPRAARDHRATNVASGTGALVADGARIQEINDGSAAAAPASERRRRHQDRRQPDHQLRLAGRHRPVLPARRRGGRVTYTRDGERADGHAHPRLGR